jgi:hypothetical protein
VIAFSDYIKEAFDNTSKSVPVYDKTGKVIATVNKSTTSIGAAKAAGATSCQWTMRFGKMGWVISEGRTLYSASTANADRTCSICKGTIKAGDSYQNYSVPKGKVCMDCFGKGKRLKA